MIEVGDLIHWECEGDKDVGVVVEVEGDAAAYKYKVRWVSPMRDQWIADFMLETIMVGKFTIIPRKR